MTDKEIHAAIGREQAKRNASRTNKARAEAKRVAALDTSGVDRMPLCPYCGDKNAVRYKHDRSMCHDCGNLRNRWYKATKHHIASEVRLLKERITHRWERALLVDKAAATGVQNYYLMVKNTEVPVMEETTKKCKQCGRELPVDQFRQYPSRGRGVYATTQGRYTICKDCESISNRVAALLRKDVLTPKDLETKEKLVVYYKKLEAMGLPLVTAAARKLLYGDAAQVQRTDNLDDLLGRTLFEGEMKGAVERHCELVRTRGYANADEADAENRRLTDALKMAGVYSEITELVDRWYLEC